MAGGTKGLVGSIAVHLGIVAVLVGVSWYASRQPSTVTEAKDTLLVVLNDGIAGRKPGLVGEKAGVAQGHETGTQNGIRPFKFKPIDIEKLKAEVQKEQASAQATATQTKADNSRPTKANGAKADAGKTSLRDFQSKQKGNGRATGSLGSVGTVSVKKGRNYGEGNNGGDGGRATEQEIYAGTVTARFKSAWSDIIASDGAASAANCGVVVKVDAAGTVTFLSWINRPKDAHIAELVKRACAQIGNCGPPPGRASFEIEFPNVGVSEG